ncbi:hypothetical protein Y695_03451 [Hydrogenophaga sp. T4]|nr:hypothetical protein Y695_03451 [Hydrogenophaga sp. T4]
MDRPTSGAPGATRASRKYGCWLSASPGRCRGSQRAVTSMTPMQASATGTPTQLSWNMPIGGRWLSMAKALTTRLVDVPTRVVTPPRMAE